VALIQQGAESIFFRNVLAVDGDLWDPHPGHKAPVTPHPKDALLG